MTENLWRISSKGMGNFIIRILALRMKASGWETSKTGLGLRTGKTGPVLKESTNRGKKTGKGYFGGLMGRVTRDTSKTMRLMGKESTFGPMAGSMMEIGAKISFTARALLSIPGSSCTEEGI